MPTRFVATLGDAEHQIEVEELAAHTLRLGIGGRDFEVDVRQVGPSSYSILLERRSFDFDVARDGDEVVVASRRGATRVGLADAARKRHHGGAARGHAGGRAELKAMMPGRVVNVLVAVGDEVALHQGIVVVEAMKMENELKSPKAGKIAEIKVKPGQTVEKGELLVVVE
jgi:biotin carboxyl carrier protein